MEYHEVIERERGEIEILLRSPDKMDKLNAMLSAAYYDPDWKWAQSLFLKLLSDEDASVRGLSATCLGHIARIHKQLDLDVVLPRLAELKVDPQIGCQVKDALDDIKFFLRFQ